MFIRIDVQFLSYYYFLDHNAFTFLIYTILISSWSKSSGRCCWARGGGRASWIRWRTRGDWWFAGLWRLWLRCFTCVYRFRLQAIVIHRKFYIYFPIIKNNRSTEIPYIITYKNQMYLFNIYYLFWNTSRLITIT